MTSTKDDPEDEDREDFADLEDLSGDEREPDSTSEPS